MADLLGAAGEKIEIQVRPPVVHDDADDLRAAVTIAARGLIDDERQVKSALRGLDSEVGRVLREAGLLDLADPGTLARLAERAADSLEAILAGGGN